MYCNHILHLEKFTLTVDSRGGGGSWVPPSSISFQAVEPGEEMGKGARKERGAGRSNLHAGAAVPS